ncbi:N-acetyltransferase [Shewanella sairae]|uniref:N-acetyltransferase n=1 Tax=Shewanella sairae TaxID=190310 RepID=A0ABQ4NYM9_9GAMM|nr:N-acetyltransferase [Shewanella sairae]MCL1131719.1 N-acetyltransferase [Shewanella sairae]GIU40070.1 N-acetyltransferase [Shewanella sairae]
MSIHIRKEQATDIQAIDAVTVAAFLDAPHTDHTEQFIVKALRKAGVLSISLVAEGGDAIVGHVAISPVTITDGAEHWYGLGPISVLPTEQGKGIGKALMQAAIEELNALNAAGCVVLGEPSYYGRFGFKATAELVLAGVPAEYFQALKLQGDLPAGEVHYHEGFAAQS